jgi:APA family basic amino acid/polyamine antiporter
MFIQGRRRTSPSAIKIFLFHLRGTEDIGYRARGKSQRFDPLEKSREDVAVEIDWDGWRRDSVTQINASTPLAPQLRRELGTFGAVMIGLGSIVGTGVFVSIGIAAGIAGPAVVLAVVLAALVAVCNGLSSAQLAATYPQSSGTYESGYKYMNPTLGFVAGWMFLCAKSASAATAALGFAGYLLSMLNLNSQLWRMGVALTAVVVLTAIVLSGIRQSNLTTLLMVMVTLGSLIFFVLGGIEGAAANFDNVFSPFFPPPSAGISPVRALFHSTALMFVAYTGYGRIAALGEEMREPGRTIPRAIVITLLAAMVLYVAVAVTAVGNVGAETFATHTMSTVAPLESIAARFGIPGAGWLLTVGAMTAMLGMLLNLIWGLSRVMLVMGRRHDMPVAVAKVRHVGGTPEIAVVIVGVLIAVLVLIGDIRTTWSLSAFTVLLYYAITNLATLQLPADKRRYPRTITMIGLLASLFLAFWVEPMIWIAGLLLIVIGLVWRWIARRL